MKKNIHSPVVQAATSREKSLAVRRAEHAGLRQQQTVPTKMPREITLLHLIRPPHLGLNVTGREDILHPCSSGAFYVNCEEPEGVLICFVAIAGIGRAKEWNTFPFSSLAALDANALSLRSHGSVGSPATGSTQVSNLTTLSDRARDWCDSRETFCRLVERKLPAYIDVSCELPNKRCHQDSDAISYLFLSCLRAATPRSRP